MSAALCIQVPFSALTKQESSKLDLGMGIKAPMSPPLTPPALSDTSSDFFGKKDFSSDSEDDYLPEPFDFSIDEKMLTEPISPQTLRTRPVVAVIGVGYVGEHLVESFGHHYPVIAYDVSPKRVEYLQKSLSYLPRLLLTTESSNLAAATHFLISVPTTARQGSIDTRFIDSALETVRKYARRGAVVVVESSVAVGMTRNLLQPLIEERGILAGMSPERVDPGRTFPALESVPKIISGLTRQSLTEIDALYSNVFETLIKVSKPEVAEMTKLYENCQRMINITFANEMADAAASIGVDPYEVAAAVATKPYGYSAYSPSWGVGGHCIPENPHFLMHNLDFPFLKAATEMSMRRPSSIARTIIKAHREDTDRRPRILVVGAGFKAGQSVLSNSPGLALAREAAELGADVAYLDPLVMQEHVPDVTKCADDITVELLEISYDVIVIGLKQEKVDWNVIRQCEDNGKVKVDWRTEKPKGY